MHPIASTLAVRHSSHSLVELALDLLSLTQATPGMLLRGRSSAHRSWLSAWRPCWAEGCGTWSSSSPAVSLPGLPIACRCWNRLRAPSAAEDVAPYCAASADANWSDLFIPLPEPGGSGGLQSLVLRNVHMPAAPDALGNLAGCLTRLSISLCEGFAEQQGELGGRAV